MTGAMLNAEIVKNAARAAGMHHYKWVGGDESAANDPAGVVDRFAMLASLAEAAIGSGQTHISISLTDWSGLLCDWYREAACRKLYGEPEPRQ